MEYFCLFDLPWDYNMELPLLTERYLKLQKEIQLQNSAISIPLEMVNKAYMILKDDFLRAEYMLQHIDLKLETRSLEKSVMENILQKSILLSELPNGPERREIILDLRNKMKSSLSAALEYAEKGNKEKAACHLLKARFMRMCVERNK